jgi:hypothetical protein
MWRTLSLCIFSLAFSQRDRFRPEEIRSLVPTTAHCSLEELATPCRTIEYREDSWTKGPRGIITVEESHERGIHAWDHDWTGVDTARLQYTRYYLWQQTWTSTRINHPLERKLLVIDHLHQTYWLMNTALGTPSWEPDNQNCEVAASHYWFSDWKLVGYSNIAGVGTVRYSGRGTDGSRIDIDFAPNIGCERFRYGHETRNDWGLVTGWTEWQITSYELGTPKPELFDLPKGYAQINSF